MEKVLGLGGVFLRADDPGALLAWYRDRLGLDLGGYGEWRHDGGPLVFATSGASFGRPEQSAMLNLRVRDLDAMLAQLRAGGDAVEDEVQDMAGVGRFGWVRDPEGNRVELWQPE